MNDDFSTAHLATAEQRLIADTIKSVLPEDASGGGCRAFYTPLEWRERNEQYGGNSRLIIVHDGGDLAPFCNMDYQDYASVEKLNAALNCIGYHFEPCTSWYAAVYKTP